MPTVAAELPVNFADQLGQRVRMSGDARLFELPDPLASQRCCSETCTGGADPIAHDKETVSLRVIVPVDAPRIFALHMVG
jgi:hypothetical protein